MVSNAIKFTPNGGHVSIMSKLIRSVDDLTIQNEIFIEKIAKNPNQVYLEV